MVDQHHNTKLRRTRIVCISDTHNCTVKLPKGDILIHAGDITNQGSYSELSRAVKWLEEAKFEAKIVIAGNHDITLDEAFYAEHGLYFHNQNPQSHEDCLSLLASSPSITYLNHTSQIIRLTSPDGPRTQLKVFGSPYSRRVTASGRSTIMRLYRRRPIPTSHVSGMISPSTLTSS
uniref:Calcineurin-like phosphoesterase domain-containing protein n=1 Tax=Bionectria ochroleuca TaxID=29856 RepID=A0A8H7KAP9_BIOOC